MAIFSLLLLRVRKRRAITLEREPSKKKQMTDNKKDAKRIKSDINLNKTRTKSCPKEHKLRSKKERRRTREREKIKRHGLDMNPM